MSVVEGLVTRTSRLALTAAVLASIPFVAFAQLYTPGVDQPLTAAQIAALCGVDKAHVNYRIGKGDLPSGRLTPSGGKREFTLAEARQWTRAYRTEKMRPAGQRAICIAVANFKGQDHLGVAVNRGPRPHIASAIRSSFSRGNVLFLGVAE